MKNIGVHKFFIRDRIKTGDIVLEHCTTERMINENFTNTLQEGKLLEFCTNIMKLSEGMTKDKLDREIQFQHWA